MRWFQLKVTETAKTKIAELIVAPNEVMSNYNFFLRVTAIEDNGVKYQVYFDYEIRLEDTLVRFKDFDLRIDSESIKYLESSVLDYSEESGFIIDDFN